jgi:Fe2+ transport system protein FeoA
MRLSELKINCPARIVDFAAVDKAMRKKLISMGLHRNAIFKVVRKAPLNGPWQIEVENSSFTVRISEIKDIIIEVIHDE